MIRRVLFVCTGNTCRSPMAQALFADMVSKDPSLCSAGIKADSAGMSAGSLPASYEAVQLMQEYGLDLTGHRSKPLDKSLIEWADLILVMEGRHKDRIVVKFPGVEKKTYLITEYAGRKGDIADPMCEREIRAYRDCAAALKSDLATVVKKLKDV